jgi:large subunit ribosomal protein L25
MAESYSLEAQARTVIGKQVKALRRSDLIPAVIYGAGGNPINVSVARRPLEIVLQKAGGTHLINVSVDGSTHTALVREVQRNKVTRKILHVDFMRVDLTKKLRTEIPLVLVGTPKLAADLQLSHNIQTIMVESLPTDIPEHVEVNVADLNAAGQQITVGDLPKLPNVDYITDPHEIIARIDMISAAPAEEEEAAAGATPAEPEVVEKGKKEEEEF